MAVDGISVVGSGWVGSVVGRGFLELGFDVIFYDVVGKDLPGFTMDLRVAIEGSQVSFVAVPTPSTGDGIDLSYVKDAVGNIGRLLRDKDEFHLVVVKSTVVPRTTEDVVIPLLEKCSGKRVGEGFGVCMNPEFLTEIASTWSEEKGVNRDFFSEDRIVIGEYDKRSGDILEEIYKPLKKPIFRTNLKTAEIIKYASNCMLATKISYWNEIFLICKELGIDSQLVADIVALDPRIGKYGTVHGKAFGGKCLPKDLKAFITFANKHHKTKLLKATDQINDEIREKFGVRE